MIDSWSVVLGGAVTGAIGWFITWHKDYRFLKRQIRLFKKAIVDDLKKSVLLYNKVKDEWNKSSTVWFVTLDEIVASRRIYEKYNDHVLNLPDNIRDRITDYYLQSANIIAGLKIQQARKYELDNIYNRLYRDASILYPNFGSEELNSYVLTIMANEVQEYNYLNDNLPKTVTELDNLRNEASRILDLKVLEK